MMSVFDVLNLLRSELPGFVSSSVVGMENGLQLACVSAIDADDSAAADAFHSDVYRTVAGALSEMGTGTERANGIVILSEHHVFLSVPLDDMFFWHVVTQSETTLGFTQAVVRKHRDAMRHEVRSLFSG